MGSPLRKSLAAADTPSRFVVGIDLGTTNSAVAYVDTAEENWRVRTLPVPQVVAAGQVAPRDTFPSFHYQPAPGELAAGAVQLPWSDAEPGFVVGEFARDQGTLVPGRQIASAKSWLCHTGVDRTADLLPWHGLPDVTRLSPVEVSSRYLAHMRSAWNARFPDSPLAEQEVVVTLPASFDELARELTVKAAQQAGLPRVVLIEEPQAAFYAWINKHADNWEQQVSPGQTILVCDIGGGTTDFTLIRVRAGSGKVQFHRVAVGEHLILGGDNLDLALARHVEEKLVPGGQLAPHQWGVLVRICRQVKETMLSDDAPAETKVVLPGSGSKMIGGGMRTTVTREEVRELLVNGFFPIVGLHEKPTARRSGFQEFGLPYAPDPAATRWLAAFLTAHGQERMKDEGGRMNKGKTGEAGVGTHTSSFPLQPSRPDVLLYNGGVFASPLLRERLLESIRGWFRSPAEPDWSPLVLDNDRLDLAVARGAAYFGMVRRGQGVRIAAGLARTYYIEVGGDAGGATGTVATDVTNVMCLVPAGVEPGQQIDLDQRRFDLLISQPVEFPLYVSSTRLTDKPGELVPLDREQMTPLPPIRTVLHARKKTETGSVPVRLHARLTEIGTLDLWCGEVGGLRKWRLQFDVRSATRTDIAAHDAVAEREGFVDEAVLEECRAIILQTFGTADSPPDGLVKRLAAATGRERREWPTSLLRQFWETLFEVEEGRKRTPLHEARWLNLVGFTLRPGFGFAADDWRVSETRRVLGGNLINSTANCLAEWWILWRRIAGGLTAGQQQALADLLLTNLRQTAKQRGASKGKPARGGSSHELAEILRLLGSLELLTPGVKTDIGNLLVELLSKNRLPEAAAALYWALARIGARRPFYGPLNAVVPVDVVSRWIELLLAAGDEPTKRLAMMQLARRTEDRYRDIAPELRGKVVQWLKSHGAAAHFIELVQEGGTLDEEEQGMVFGEALPRGLRML